MLRIDDRALFVDLLTPPDGGYRLERAVGTTFTMQLESLLRVPLAVVGSEWHDNANPLGVMEAVRSSTDRIDVFCQAGGLSVPSAANPLLAFLEPVVHQVARPAPGRLFHPKMWLASFTNGDGERRFRLLCGSRNLTGDRAWDAVVGLDGAQGPVVVDVNEPLVGLVSSLAGRVAGGIDPAREAGIAQLAQAARRAVWEPPQHVASGDWLNFHWLDTHRAVRSFSGATRRLVISPFLTVDGVERVWPDGACTLVSRAESFAALGVEYVHDLTDQWDTTMFELDDTAALPDEDDEDTGLRWSLRGLHAKVYIEDRGRNSHVLVGSANATGAAWAGNTEFMVELVGPTRHFGVDAVLADVAGGFRQVLRTVDHEALTKVSDDPTLQRQLEGALVDIAALAHRAVATEENDGWSEHVSTAVEVGGPFPGNAELTVRLLTSLDTRAVIQGSPVTAQWSGLDGEDVTPYLVVALTSGTTTAACVVLADLIGGPDDRIDRLIARQVGDPEAFLQFLMLLLQLGSGDEAAVAALISGGYTSHSADGFLGGSSGVLEALVVALADHPHSLDEIDRLVDRLSATEEGRKVLPEGWDELWTSVSEARAELDSGR